MTRLKCFKCGKVFDKKAIINYGAVGATGGKVGGSCGFIVWPLTMKVYASCSTCNKKGWLKVLPPWKKNKLAN